MVETRPFLLSLTPYVLAVAAAGAATAVGARLLLRFEESRMIASRMEYLSVVTNLEAETISHFHKERMHDLRIYTENLSLAPSYALAMRGDPDARRLLTKVFKPLMDGGAVAQVALFDRRGRLAASLPESFPAPPPATSALRSARFLGLRTTAGGEPFLDYEGPLADGGRLLLRVQCDAALSPLLNVWPGTEKTARTTIYQQEEGTLLVLNELVQGRVPLIPRRVDLASEVISARAARGANGPILGIDHLGVSNYAVVARLPDFGWLVVTKMAEQEVLAPMREKARLLALAAAGFFAIVCSVFLVVARAHLDRVRAEADADRRLLAAAIEQAGESVVITDTAARILYTNPAFTRATGYSREEAKGRNPAILKSGRQDAAFYRGLWGTLTRGEAWKGRFVNRRKDGSLYEEEATITPIRDARGAISHYIAVKRDVSAIKSLEDQLYHSQKMEAIGRLAGGVAHDFNNILTTINGYAEMLADAAPPDSQGASDLAEILGAGRRAALLTRQLLTFSRRAPADPVVLDLRLLIRAMEKMLRRTLGEDVRLALQLPAEPLWVRSDAGQIDQVLMNLAVNARDAMPRGGTLTVRARVVRLDSDEVRSLEVIPAGRYAELVVSDDGEGMDATVLERIFEPFFTTKEKGKGTGLGLATVFGIVKQNNGHITVASAPGRGAAFTIHLPLAEAPAGLPEGAAAPSPASARGDETVLVVEDQSEVLRLVARALTPQGYRVISCASGGEALETARAFEGTIHLLLTDVVMPGIGGEELASMLRRERPETRILYMSGYTDGRLDGLVVAGEKADLLLKPFTAEQLCRRVRDALDGAVPRMA